MYATCLLIRLFENTKNYLTANTGKFHFTTPVQVHDMFFVEQFANFSMPLQYAVNSSK